MRLYEWIRSIRLGRWSGFWKEIWVQMAGWSFRSQRADYYEYLADLIDATGGSKTLLNIFQDDALRYPTGARGVLSRVWLERFPQAGGDLFSTWSATLPLEDLLAIQSAQYAGADALTRTLRQLANVVRLVDRARLILLTTAFSGIAALFWHLVQFYRFHFLQQNNLERFLQRFLQNIFLLGQRLCLRQKRS